MKCPFCKTELIKSSTPKRFETLIEHGFEPNKEVYPLRDNFICPSTSCPLSRGSFWSEDGDFYMGINLISYEEFHIWKNKNGGVAAIDSFAGWLERRNELEKKLYPLLFWAKYKYDVASRITDLVFGKSYHTNAT